MIKKGLLISLLTVLLGILVWTQRSFAADLQRLAVMSGRFEESFFCWLGMESEMLWRLISGVSVIIKILLCRVVQWRTPQPCNRAASFIVHRPMRVVGYGLTGYAAFLLLILLFLFSVIGLPMAFLFIFVVWLLTSVGEIPLGLAAGALLCDSLHWKASANTYALIGVLLIESIRRAPFFGYWVTFLLLPVMCLGIVITVVYEGYFKKNFCAPVFLKETKTDQSKTKEIILKGIAK